MSFQYRRKICIFSKGLNPLLINSSNLQSLRKRFYARYTQKTQKVMGTILVAGKHLNLVVRGPGEKVTRSSGTGGSHPGLEPRSVSGGEAGDLAA